jgi:hypothetical protein
VALLPQELSGSEERLRVLELPSDDRVPLVELEREVSVRVDPLGIVYRELGASSESPSLQGYMTVSEVGRIAIGSSRSDLPLDVSWLKVMGEAAYARVTHATSGAKPSMWSFSFSRRECETNIGK